MDWPSKRQRQQTFICLILTYVTELRIVYKHNYNTMLQLTIRYSSPKILTRQLLSQVTQNFVNYKEKHASLSSEEACVSAYRTVERRDNFSLL